MRYACKMHQVIIGRGMFFESGLTHLLVNGQFLAWKFKVVFVAVLRQNRQTLGP